MIAYQFNVGRYQVEVSVPEPEDGQPVGLRFEWSPHVPTTMSRAERRQYERGRGKAIAHLTDELHQAALAARLTLDPDPLRVVH